MKSSEEFEQPDNSEAQATSSPGHPVSPSPLRPISASLFTWLARISRFLLAALFLFTAAAKLAIVKSFAQNMAQLLSASGFNYERWSWPATVAVITIEIAVAILLLWPRTIRIGAFFAGLLLLTFAGYALYYVYVLKVSHSSVDASVESSRVSLASPLHCVISR